jgi:serine/threonine-protein kinase
MPPGDESRARLSALAEDQQRRWRDGQGEPLTVEAYLREWPELADRPEAVLFLLLNELLLRSERGEALLLEEYQRRFPALAADLDELFGRLPSLRLALDAPEPPAGPPAPPRRRRRAGPRALPEVPGYEVLEFLDGGGQGDVFRARHVLLRRVVALKVLNRRDDDDEVLARFAREGRLGALPDHPNVLRVYDCARHDGRLYISMEYAPGGSLADRLEGGPLPPAEAARLLAALARGVHHLSAAHRIVHRDLKPSNVLFAADGTPKVADFGLAKRLAPDASKLTQGPAVLGTASYMAPEQAVGRDVTAATDIWALGAILFECLTGAPPFRGENWLETIELVKTQPVPPPSQRRAGLPPALERICLRCLEKTADRRYPTAGELAEELERFLSGETQRPVPAAPDRRLRAAEAVALERFLSGETQRPEPDRLTDTNDRRPDAAIAGPAGSSLSRTRDEGPAARPGPVSPSAMPEVPGYEILEEIGRGSRGVVYKARQVSPDRIVALKVMAQADVGSPEMVRAFRRFWVQAPAALRSHPNFVQVHDLGEHEGALFVVMEFVTGGSLRERLPGHLPPVKAAVQLVERLASACGSLHARHMIHRHLHPGNILLDRPKRATEAEAASVAGLLIRCKPVPSSDAEGLYGIPKIADFGAPPEALDRMTQVGAPPEALAYVAPEQGRDAVLQGPGCDVWSLGVVLYEMLTGGRRPFVGKRVSDLLWQVHNVDPGPPSRSRAGVPPSLDTICLKCLSKDPGIRFRDGEELAAALRKWLRGGGDDDEPRGGDDEPRPWWRRLFSWR